MTNFKDFCNVTFTSFVKLQKLKWKREKDDVLQTSFFQRLWQGSGSVESTAKNMKHFIHICKSFFMAFLKAVPSC